MNPRLETLKLRAQLAFNHQEKKLFRLASKALPATLAGRVADRSGCGWLRFFYMAMVLTLPMRVFRD